MYAQLWRSRLRYYQRYHGPFYNRVIRSLIRVGVRDTDCAPAGQVNTRLTAAIIARDEEELLGDCLRSVSFADEILVLVDAATRDRTREVALAGGARVEERPFDNFAAQRDAALGLAASDWVLFVDADERVTPALQAEVLARIADPR